MWPFWSVDSSETVRPGVLECANSLLLGYFEGIGHNDTLLCGVKTLSRYSSKDTPIYLLFLVHSSLDIFTGERYFWIVGTK